MLDECLGLFFTERVRSANLEIEAEINEKFGAPESNDELGELPYDAEADRKRWDELEKDFDRIFEDAARPAD